MKKQPSYQEFEPYCKWQKGQQQDILEVHVQGFRKEQLKATINSLGVLKSTGELSLDEHRPISFRKEINISKDFKMDDIIYVTMPKRIPSDSAQADKPVQENGDKRTDLPAATLRTMNNQTKCISDAVPTLEKSRKTALKLGAALAAVLAVAAYVAYKNRQA